MFLVLAVLTFSAGYCFALEAQPVSPIGLTLTQESKQCVIGESCLVRVTLLNVSKETVPVRLTSGEDSAYSDYQFEIKRKDGKPLVRRDPLNPGHGVIVSPMQSDLKIPVLPGQAPYCTFSVGDIAKINRPGTYLIKVQRDNKTYGPYWTATSNTLAVTYAR